MATRERLLEMALKGLQADRARLDEEIAEIKRELGSAPAAARAEETATATAASSPKRRRKMSADARRRISEGMKRRYAVLRAATETPASRKQTAAVILTPAGRKKLSDMMKARWAAKRKAAAKGIKK